ncbi:Retrotransposon-like protein 1 [Anabarilius grahami]|uniref:Retrotransposon-like protein 1 n=1 Tax=Anabarilius grahami TaxID=495550 RepID=A0A3N0Z4Y3_ANAGA|nr:Retrotransposon-like protein 1 [Anabarilius grahami]
MSTADPFQDLVTALRRTLTGTSTPAPPASTSAFHTASSSPSVTASHMAKPAPFSGSAEDCNGFILQCSLVLEMQSHLYPDDKAKVAFMIQQLDGKALRWAEPLWTQNTPVVQSLSSFINHFKEVFGKPSWDSSLGERLCNLKQGALSVSDYALQFRTLVAASGWNEQALISRYHQGLDPREQFHLAAYKDTIRLEKFIQLSIRFATRMQLCIEEHQNQRLFPSFHRQPESVSSPEPASRHAD